MIEVSQEQINAFRLTNACLTEETSAVKTPVRIVEDICGAQAQVLSAGLLSLAVRSGVYDRSVYDDLLFHKRTLLKIWAMRGTLYLVSANDLPVYTSAFGVNAVSSYVKMMQKFYNVPPKKTELLLTSLERYFSAIPQTKRELAEQVADELGEWVKPYLHSGWGGAVKRFVQQGIVSYAGQRGQEATFVRRDSWIKKWKDISTEEARSVIARRFIHTYGPIARPDLGFWLGVSKVDADTYWKSIEDELMTVSNQGKVLYILRKDKHKLLRSVNTGLVNLLPFFDQFLLAHRQKDHLVEQKHYKKIYRTAGWISPAIIQDGKVIGKWDYAKRSETVTVECQLFSNGAKMLKEQIRQKAHTIAPFFEGNITVKFT